MNPETEIILNFLRTSGMSLPSEGKKRAKRLRKLVTHEIIPSSIRVRSLMSASGEIPVLVSELLRSALDNVDWDAIVDNLGETDER